MAPWYAAVGEASGIGCTQLYQLVVRENWFAEERAANGQLEQAARNAATFESSQHVAAYRINALDAVTGTFWSLRRVL